MPSSADLLSTAREAYARHDWPEAYRALKAASAQQPLATDDLFALGDAAWWLGLIKETLAISEECHRHFLEEGRVQHAAMNALGIGFSWFLRGEMTIGSGWVSRARRLLADQPDCAELGYLRWLDASEMLESGDIDAALACSREVKDFGERFASPALVALGLTCEGKARIRAGDVPGGFRLLDEAMLPVLAGQVEPEWAGNIYCELMGVCHDLGDVRRASEWTAATERWCDSLPSAVMFAGICRMHRVQLLQIRGDWSAAEREASVACTELAEMNVAVVAEAHHQLAELARLRDDLTVAEDEYRKAQELGRDPHPGLALLRLCQGRPDEAWSAVRLALDDPTTGPFRRTRLLVAAVEIALERGDIESAAKAQEELDSLARRYESPGFAAWTLHAAGAVLLARHRPDEAIVASTEALRRYTDVSAPFEAASTRVLIGRAHALKGELDASNLALDAAAVTFEELGAAMPLRRLAASRGTASLPAGLTRREAQVLACVADGASNKQAAETLFISEKTVARHLANIFAKIGVSSRTAAAAWSRENRIARFVPDA